MLTSRSCLLTWQALVDQHGTRLTLTQASSDVIADAAPAQERLQVHPTASLASPHICTAQGFVPFLWLALTSGLCV